MTSTDSLPVPGTQATGTGRYQTADTERLTAVSLFAGIGGFDLALERSGVDVVAAVEIDPAARGVLADRFPDTTLFTDVREVTGAALRAAGFVPERGIITAGWPCTDLSVAGHRLGLGEGTRSGLYWHVDRLVDELRPAWVIYENVPGLLSATCPCPGTGQHEIRVAVRTGDDGDDPVDIESFPCAQPHAVPGGACPGGCFPAHGGAMGLVLGALADRGYGFAYRVLDAQYTGVPQRRRRVIFVGRAGGDPRGPVQVLLEPDSRTGDSPPGGAPRAGTADVTTVSTLQGGGQRGYRIDAEAAAGGHLVPVAFDAAQITSAENRSNPKPGDPAPSLSATGYPHVAHTHVPMAFNPQTGGDLRLGYSETPTALTTNQITAVQLATAVRRLTPLECERLQGFPDNWTATSNGKPQADAPRYRQCGNAVAVPVVEWVAGRLMAHIREVAA